MPGPHELNLLPERMLLPRGVGALPGAEVAASQRGRILQAITEQVAEGGYHATSVQNVIRRARVSRSAFYSAFRDKEDAFAAAHLLASEQLFDLIAAAVLAAPADWSARLRAGLTAYLEGLISAPAYAASFMVEIRAAGPRLLDQRDAVLERHAGRLARVAHAAHREHPVRPPLSRAAIIGLTGAVDELATREIRAGRITGLLDLVDPIMELHLAALT